MFQKVLIAEDQDIINVGIHTQLKSLGVLKIEQVKYCDDAILKLKRAIYDKEPYDLLITDLSFEKDYREQKYTSGEELVKGLLTQKIHIPTLVYSVEDNPELVRRLLHDYDVNAYVCKGRNSTKELLEAIHHIYTKKETKYVSAKLAQLKQNTIGNDLDAYDIKLLKKLAEGLSQKEISTYFIAHNISPNSLSSVEKRINRLKDLFRATNPVQLIAITKDAGFI